MCIRDSYTGAVVTADHVKRNFNTWADDLSKKLTDGFDENKRRHLDITDDNIWMIWSKLKDQGNRS